jgi:hypothetical protein
MQAQTDAARAFIIQRMARFEAPSRIAEAVKANFDIEVDLEQILTFWRDRNIPPTRTGPAPEHATPTGPAQEHATRTGPAPEPATRTGPAPEHATRTGPIPEEPRQEGESMAILSDEIKEFIVRGLARYDTPTEVAAAVKAQFGIEITRYQVNEYNPLSSRPPASRWCELHAVTREKFLDDIASIGIAQKAYRLKMLDQFAQRALANGSSFHAAEFMVLAAKECGGFYERRRSRAAAQNQPPKDTAP